MRIDNNEFVYADSDENSGGINYFLFTSVRSGSRDHFIMKYDETTNEKTSRWACSKTGSYSTNWSNRATLTYFFPSISWEKQNLIESI